MKIRAFGFRRGTGKDTLCRMVQKNLRLRHRNLRVNVMGFADQLKTVCYNLYGWLGVKPPNYYEENPAEKDTPMMSLPCNWKTVREMWIGVGHHMRTLDRAVWLNALLRTQTCDVLLIKDLRFPDELEAVRNQHGLCCRIDRPGTEKADGQPDTVLMNIPDEGWDKIYLNDGDLHKLHELAIQICGEIE